MQKAPTGMDLARELCRQFPDSQNRTLARRLFDENRERFSNLEAARNVIRKVRGQHGKASRVKAANKIPKPAGKAGWKPACPPSFAEPWQSVQIDGPAKVLSLSDVHIPYHDVKALEAAVEYGRRKIKPDVLLLNGDYADFYNISRWQKDPKKRDFADEIEMCKEGLQWLRYKFPKARMIFKLGNHEQRWDHYLWNNAPMFCKLENIQLHESLEFESLGIERVDDNPILAGELPILHGHEMQKGGSPVNPARGSFLRLNHSCLSGHLHRTSTHCEPDMWHRECTTWTQGCLCDLTPEYARTNKWNWGFSAVDVSIDNSYNVNNFRLSSDYEVRTA